MLQALGSLRSKNSMAVEEIERSHCLAARSPSTPEPQDRAGLNHEELAKRNRLFHIALDINKQIEC